jgi:hypothetical protein
MLSPSLFFAFLNAKKRNARNAMHPRKKMIPKVRKMSEAK